MSDLEKKKQVHAKIKINKFKPLSNAMHKNQVKMD